MLAMIDTGCCSDNRHLETLIRFGGLPACVYMHECVYYGCVYLFNYLYTYKCMCVYIMLYDLIFHFLCLSCLMEE